MPPYTRTIPDPTWTTAGNIVETFIIDPSGVAVDIFGSASTMSNDGRTIAIGASGDNSFTGAVHVYTFQIDGSWALQQKIISSEPVADYDYYGGFGQDGIALSNNGDIMCIPNATKDDGQTNAGTVYIWVRDANGVWTEEQIIDTAGTQAYYGRFGKSVSLSGDGRTLCIGHPFVDTNGRTNNGEAEIWTRSGTTWTVEDTIEDPNWETDAKFGYNVSLSRDGNVAAIGAYGHTLYTGATTFTTSTGDVNKDIVYTSAYTGFFNKIPSKNIRIIYTVAGTSTPLTVGTNDLGTGFFEITVNIETDSGGLGISTAAEIKTAVDAHATAPSYVTTAQAGTGAGVITANLSGYLTSGATYYSHVGGVNIFTRSGTTWTFQQKVQPGVSGVYQYGGWPCEVSDDGKTLIMSVPYDDTGTGGNNSGAVYLYSESGGTWTLDEKITPSDSQGGDAFGLLQVSLSANGNTAVIGSHLYDGGAGQVYIWTRSGTNWTEKQIILPSDGAAFNNDRFGRVQAAGSMSGDGYSFITAAPYNDIGAASNQGAVYIYNYPVGT